MNNDIPDYVLTVLTKPLAFNAILDEETLVHFIVCQMEQFLARIDHFVSDIFHKTHLEQISGYIFTFYSILFSYFVAPF